MIEEPTPEQRILAIIRKIRGFLEKYPGGSVPDESVMEVFQAFFADFPDLLQDDLDQDNLDQRISTFAEMYVENLGRAQASPSSSNGFGGHNTFYTVLWKRLFRRHCKRS